MALGHVDHFYIRGVRGAGLRLVLGPLDPGAIAVPPIVAHHLKPFVRDMLGDGRNKLLGREDLNVALGLGVHSGAVDHGTVLSVVDHLLLGEGVADNVLGYAFKPGGIITSQRLAVVYAEPAVFSRDHVVPHVVAEGMNGHDHTELTGGAIETVAQEFEQALVGE